MILYRVADAERSTTVPRTDANDQRVRIKYLAGHRTSRISWRYGGSSCRRRVDLFIRYYKRNTMVVFLPADLSGEAVSYVAVILKTYFLVKLFYNIKQVSVI